MNEIETRVPFATGTVPEVRPDLRSGLAAGWNKTRHTRLPVAACAISIIVLALAVDGFRTEWSQLGGMALAALGAGLAIAWPTARGKIHHGAWIMLVVMGAPAAIGLAQWFRAASADWAATETGILRSLAAALFCGGLSTLRDSERRDRVMDALAMVGGLIALLSLLQSGLAQPLAWWPFPNRNHFAAFCELLFPMAAWRAGHHRSGGWQVLPAVALALGGMLSGSRAGLLLLAAEILLLGGWMLRTKRTLSRGKWLGAVVLSLPLITALLGGEALWTRWREAPVLLYRDQIWAASWDLLWEKPWQGHGLGSFATVYPSAARFDTGEVVHRAHNDWLEWIVEGGLPAACPMLLLLALLVPRLKQMPWALGVPAVLAHSLVDYPLHRFSLLLLFGLIATLALMESPESLLQRRTRKRLSQKPFGAAESFPANTLQ